MNPKPPGTADLFDSASSETSAQARVSWPPAERFPLNVGRRTVRQSILADLRESPRPLIVTGFASLDELIDLVVSLPEPESQIRLLLGSEPFPGRRESYHLDERPFPREVEAYWLARGVSLTHSAKLIDFIHRLERGTIEARYLASSRQRLHAKIYIGAGAATIGSSNFTTSGLDRQLEANTRFSSQREHKRYRELCDVAEGFWQLGQDYRDDLIALLERLLRLVTWREALARACAELLEGEWAKRFLASSPQLNTSVLWPSQVQGIARALYILDRQGSVLIADATGSGKTRMGAHLVRAITDWMLRAGRLRYGRALMVCPPAVADAWEREKFEANAQLETRSHGTLSHARSRDHERIVESLRQAQILCVDEGHNFLNASSNRTAQLLRNMADHVILFTATPINRSVTDLLRIADMLGADNLEPSTLEAFKRMLGARRIDRTLTEEERDSLRNEIRRFTVRRTKRELNALIADAPDRYRDARDQPCRFPKHRPLTYTLDEPAADRDAAHQIRELAGSLHAATHFRKPLEMPEVLAREGWTEQKYLASRLESARKLARYVVMASLRSSRAALIEHIEGTEKAKRHVGLERFKRQRSSGHMLEVLSNLAGHPPPSRLSIPVPPWLTEPQAHREACAHDRAIYARILRLVAGMSDTRERRKVELLIERLGAHELVLAFDSRPITLAYVAQAIGEHQGQGVRVLVATGEPSSQRNALMQAFAPGAGERGIIGLCSDSLAEGVNLQQAPCVVHLDMPSVVRVAEQRVGRVDRMDSPHAEIEAWWPDDAPQFCLSSDERFIERYETVESLLGSNMPLPEQMQRADAERVDARQMIAEFESIGTSDWDGIEDAFAPVRQLIEGGDALVDVDSYAEYRDPGRAEVRTEVLARVSLVRAQRPWAFFCLGSDDLAAPRWVLFTDATSPPLTDLADVSAELRARLDTDVEPAHMDAAAVRGLNRFLRQLARYERTLLPRRKQRAVEEMEAVLAHYLDAARGAGIDARAIAYHRLLEHLHTGEPDWNEVASGWLDLIRPIWYDRLKSRRSKPLLLRDIRSDLFRREDTLGVQCIERFATLPRAVPATERIRACIIGVQS